MSNDNIPAILNQTAPVLERAQGFIEAVNRIFAEANAKASEHMRDYNKPLEIRNGRVSGDWLVLDHRYSGAGCSVYAFIRLTDGENKTLGVMKAGDIHRPASYKIPAKHARASVFNADFGASCAGLYGVAYLR
jgi:hypothetical protein